MFGFSYSYFYRPPPSFRGCLNRFEYARKCDIELRRRALRRPAKPPTYARRKPLRRPKKREPKDRP